MSYSNVCKWCNVQTDPFPAKRYLSSFESCWSLSTYTTIDWIWQMILKTKLLFCLVTTRTFSNCTDHLFSQPPHTSKTRKNTFEIIILHIITTFLAVFKALYIVLWSWLNRLFSKLHFLSSEVTAWTSGNSTDIY